VSSSLGRILGALDRDGPQARHRIADATGLTRATVSTAAQVLIDHGLVRETDRAEGSPRGGPRPILMSIIPEGLNVLGLDIRREKFTGVLVDLAGRQVAGVSHAVAIGAAREHVLGTIEAIRDELLPRATGPLAAMGVGSVGPLLVAEGVINSPHFPSLSGLPVVELLEERFGVPVELRTGAVAAAYGEERIAIGQRAPAGSVAFVVIDYAGIGIGLISGDAGWITDHGGVGELGHVSIERGGRPCPCGRSGCLLQYASGRAVLEALGLAGASDPGAELARIAREADAGDARIRLALEEAGRWLGYALDDADRILRPERMVLAASHDRLADWYLKGALSYLDTLPNERVGRPLRDRIHLSEMGTTAIAYGAATLQLKTVIRTPEGALERIAAARRRRASAERQPITAAQAPSP